MTDSFETHLRDLAQGFTYPPTPRVAEMVLEKLHARTAPRRFITLKFARALVVAIILIAGLMAVPPVRAAVLEFIQIGIVRIFPPQPTVEAPSTALPDPIAPSTATPGSSAFLLIPFLNDIAGETTLEVAQHTAGFPIPLPAYPEDLGSPDHIYVQDANGDMVVLVWVDPAQPLRVLMSLHIIEAGSWAIEKVEPVVIEETTVDGVRALWTVGPYPLLMHNRDILFARLVNGHVLIWEKSGITYRLETDLSLEEAIRVAESLQVP
jgi:hypothetical protein